jgi:putative CocE/NonD family hydrolase
LTPLDLLRAAFDLPPRRFPASVDCQWVAMPDGVRLATWVWRPLGVPRAPAVLIRTAYGSRSWRVPMRIVARLLAEAGFACALQDVRGRYASEGAFEPFVSEAADGERSIAWVLEQPWCDGRLGLVGFSYLAFTAWAAAARAPDAVRAIAAGIGASDFHASFYPGGAFALETALRWAAGLGEREDLPERRLDLQRAFRFRPVIGADRVAVRERSFYRDWLAHPRADGFWHARTPELRRMPPALLIAGWYDLFLGPQLADYAALAAGGARRPPRLVVGPWTHGRYLRRTWSPRAQWFGHVALREILGFLGRELAGDGADDAGRPVRLYELFGRGWIEADAWPPRDAREQSLYLRSGGRANTLAGDGRLAPDAPDGEPPDRFVYDPDDPAPTLGGALLGPGGALDQRRAEARADVLCYTSAPFERALSLAGPVRAVLFAASSAPDTDFTAKLVLVTPDGQALLLCEGISRCRWRQGGSEPVWLEPDAAARIEVDLWATCARIAPGHRLRLEVSSSSLPRFDRNPNTRGDPARAERGTPARQTVLHDAEHPSRLVLHVL